MKWKDSQTSWLPLKDLKEFYPLVADFANSQGISDEAAFRWWVPHVMRKRKTIISMSDKEDT